MSVTLRQATVEDAVAIGLLHATSWQQHYKNVLDPSYLKEKVVDDRLEVWQLRLTHPASNQYILLAETAQKLCGFICLLFREDPKWGTLLDNLHVSSLFKNKGIGTQLLQAGLDWSYQQDPNAPVHLWVYESNIDAIAFYEKLGGRSMEQKLHHNPDGGSATALRYVWNM